MNTKDSTEKKQLHNLDPNARWLSWVRIMYVLYFLWARGDNGSEYLAELSDNFFSPPMGPFMVFTGWPTWEVFLLIQLATTVTLIALLLGLQPILSSYLVSFFLIVEAGLRYSTGKIDHDIVLLILPVLLAKNWGQLLAVFPSTSKPFNPRPVAWVIGFYYFSSGCIKLSSGYLDLSQQAIAGWLEFYIVNYGFSGVLATPILSLPNGALELLDWAAVVFELSMLYLMLKPKLVKFGLILGLMFQLVVYLTFGIDFLKLILVYLALVAVKVPFAPRKISLVASIALATLAIFGAIPYQTAIAWLSSSYPSALSFLFFLTITLGFGAVLVSQPAVANSFVPKKGAWFRRLALGLFLFAPLALTIAWTEPYPAVIGPGFRAGVSGDFVFKVYSEGVLSDPTSATGVPMPYAQNILFHIFPPLDGQGHETRPIAPATGRNPLNFQGVWEKRFP
jgi:hypothetical protein